MEGLTTGASDGTDAARGFLFLVFEGLDGTGKTTLASELTGRLRDSGRDARLLREPGGTPLGEAVREILLRRGRDLSVAPGAELMLYMASRAQLLRQEIEPAAHRGGAVILDRFFYSSVAYQGHGLGLDPAFIEALGGRLLGKLEPHRVLLLDCDPSVALGRLPGPRDRIESRDLAFFGRVREGFLAQARARPDLFRVVDANRSLAEVRRSVMEQLDDVL